MEEALRAAEAAREAAERAAQESRARHQEAVEALIKNLANSLDQSMHEQFGKLLAAVEELKQPSPPNEDVQIGRLYRLYLCSGGRGTIHSFIEWVDQDEEHRQWARLAIQALFEGEEARQHHVPSSGKRKPKTLLSQEKRARYEGLLAQGQTVQGGTDLVA